MSRKLLTLNIALVVLIGAAVWQIWRISEASASRRQAVLGRTIEAAEVAPESVLEPSPPLTAARYFDVAQQLLFSSDRNPDVVVETAAPKPLPPLPYAHGVMDLGSGPTVILSPNTGDEQRGYRVGEEIGGYKIVAITATDLYLDFEGQRVRRAIDELKPDAGESAPPPPLVAPAKAKPAPKSKVLAEPASSKAGPGTTNLGGGLKSCQPGDNSPSGTVADGYRKVVTPTPFGNACRWEPVQ